MSEPWNTPPGATLPQIEGPEAVECETCEGNGYLCRQCGCGVERGEPCPHCGPEGTTICPACEGDKVVSKHSL